MQPSGHTSYVTRSILPSLLYTLKGCEVVNRKIFFDGLAISHHKKQVKGIFVRVGPLRCAVKQARGGMAKYLFARVNAPNPLLEENVQDFGEMHLN